MFGYRGAGSHDADYQRSGRSSWPVAATKSYAQGVDARLSSGCTDHPGYGLVRWTARELTLPDGSVFATVLDTATDSEGIPLSEAGRSELIFWESMTA